MTSLIHQIADHNSLVAVGAYADRRDAAAEVLQAYAHICGRSRAARPVFRIRNALVPAVEVLVTGFAW